MTNSVPLDPRDVVDGVLSRPSRRVEVLLRDAFRDEGVPDSGITVLIASLAKGQTIEGNNLDVTSPFWRASNELRPYEKRRHGSDATVVTFWPEDFPAFFVDLALAVGIDVVTYGRKLQPSARSPEYAVGRALTVLAQIEGVYKEVPGALTETRVNRQFLYVVASALIGIISGSGVGSNPLVVGAIGGIGGLLLEILANRYDTNLEPETDFLEDMLLVVLEQQGRMSRAQLAATVHMSSALLTSTIRRLLKKNLIRRVPTFTDGKAVMYDLAER